MEEKSLRYRPWFFAVILIVFSIISAFLIAKLNFNFTNTKDLSGAVYKIVEDVVRKPMNYDNYQTKNENDKIKFVLKKSHIENYEFTEKYKKENPKSIVAISDFGEKMLFNNENDFLEASKEINFVKTNQNSAEKPSINTTFVGNVQNYYAPEFEPSKDIESLFDGKSAWVKGTIIEGKHEITSNKSDFQKLESSNGQAVKLLDMTESTLNDFFDTTTDLDFYYEFDVEGGVIEDYIKRNDFVINFFSKSLLIMTVTTLVMIVYLAMLNYKKSLYFHTIAGIINIPVEIYIMLTIGTFFVFGFNFNMIVEQYGVMDFLEMFRLNAVYQFLAAFVVMLVILTLISYIVFVLKSLYYDGFKSFLFENSIVIRIMKMIKRFIGWMLNKIKSFLFNLFGTYGPRRRIFLVALFLFSTFIIFVLTLDSRFGSFPFMVFTLVLVGIFYLYNKYFRDLREIEEVSEKIAVGDYHTKIDESSNLYKKLARNLNLAGDSLNLAIGKELKAERMRTELITNVSHDLKTPLTSIINYSQLADSEDASEEEIRNYAKIINEKAHKLKNLIENLFEVSKATTKNIELNMIDLDFSEMVNQISGEWTDKFEEKGLSIINSSPDEPVILKLDGQQMSRILDNVFSNIYKYAMDNTRVYVDLSKDEKVKLQVKNISKYPLNISADELLERFTRGDASRNTEGSGLGLSIASSLTELQGGNFGIEIVGDLFMIEIVF